MGADSDVKTSLKPRYAFSKTASRVQRQANKSETGIEKENSANSATHHNHESMANDNTGEKTKRHTQSELPPLEYTIYLDSNGAVVSPEYFLEHLQAPYPDGTSDAAKSDPIQTFYTPNKIQRTNPVQYVPHSNQKPHYSYVNAPPAVKPNCKPVPKPILTTIAKPIAKGYTHPIPSSCIQPQTLSAAIEHPKPCAVCHYPNPPKPIIPKPPVNTPPICNCPLIPASSTNNTNDDSNSINGANIKKGISILNQGLCPKKIADCSEERDDEESDPVADVKGIKSSSTGIQYEQSELIDAIKKLTSKINEPKGCKYDDDDDDDYPDDDEDCSEEEPTDCDCESEPNDSNDDCATGHDLVEACKNLSKTIATYKLPSTS